MTAFPVTICPPPKLQFFNQNGKPLAGGLLFTYAGGTTNKISTYTDSGGATPNTNPIVLNALGEPPAGVFVTPEINIKFVLSPAGDSDPPTNSIWTVDNVAAAPIAIGSMALQDADSVDITGGSVQVGTLKCTGGTSLSTLAVSGNVALNGNQLAVDGNSTFGGTATFSGAVTINANVNVNASVMSLGSLVGNASLEIQSLSTGFQAAILMQTGASSRWGIYKDSTAESGSNTGSDFRLDAYDNGGALNFTAMKVSRSTGLVTIKSLLINTNGGLTVAGQTTGAGSSTATFTNAPSAGNPAFYLPITINGTLFYIPCLSA